MGSKTDKTTINELPRLPPLATPPKKGEGKDKKHTFTSTITAANKRRLTNYQSNKPGGALTTDVMNQALKRFFNANTQYADVDPVKPRRR